MANDLDVDRDLERVRSSDTMRENQSEYEQAGGKTELSSMRCTRLIMMISNLFAEFLTPRRLLFLKFSDYGVEISGKLFL